MAVLELHINGTGFGCLFPLPTLSVSCWLLHIVHSTKQPLPANHPNQLPQGSGSIRPSEMRSHMPTYMHTSAQDNDKKPLPSKEQLWSISLMHTITSGSCVTHLSTKVHWKVLECRNHAFFSSPFRSPTMTGELARSSAYWSAFAWNVWVEMDFECLFFFF